MDGMEISDQLEEIQLIRCSLLGPLETITFTMEQAQNDLWMADNAVDPSILDWPIQFRVTVDDAFVPSIWIECELPLEYCPRCNDDAPEHGIPGNNVQPLFSVKRQNMSRQEQQQWQDISREKWEEVISEGNPYPLYQLILTHLLPCLHEAIDAEKSANSTSATSAEVSTHASQPFHACLTSHHLIAPSKRKSLQQWVSNLRLSGFAKVGYPGVIYVEGHRREDVEEFVGNVKAMQWLALRVRFVEPIDSVREVAAGDGPWAEFTKVGEVVAEMKRLGRESHILNLGIGRGNS